MYKIILELLENRNEKEFIKYQLLRRLIIYISSQNEINIPEEIFFELMKKIYDKNYKIEIKNNELRRIFLFCNELLDIYLGDKKVTMTSIVEKYEFNNKMKEFLLGEKESFENIIHYYLNKKSFYGEFNTIYSNEYFIIKELSKKECLGDKMYSEVEEGIGIRVLFQGKFLYKSGALLKNGEYLIRDLSKPIDEAIILSNDVHGIIINLTDKFIKTFNVRKPENIINMKLSKFQVNLLDLLDINVLKYENLMIFETIILLLKFYDLIDEDCETITELLNYNEISINEITDVIKKNIRYSIEELEDIVMKKYDISSFRLNDIIYESSRTTFRKYVLEMKIHYVVNFYVNSNSTLEEALQHYSIENINIFKYNLKKFSNLGLKDLQRLKKDIEEYENSAS